MIKTKNFNPKSDPKLICTCKHIDCDKRSVNQETLDRLQAVRDIVKRPMIVTSGGRCPNHFNEVGRLEPADHQRRQGVDIAVNGGLERGELGKAAIDSGFNAIGFHKDFVHMGYREELGDELMVWVY